MTAERNGPGRPPFNPTPEMRDEVELLVMCGKGQRQIAAALGITCVTLEKHFRDELDHGMERKFRQIVKMLHKSAENGNVAAQKKLLEIGEKQAAFAQLEQHVPVRLQPGKKEVAASRAQTAGEGTKWGDYLRDDEIKPKDLPN